MRTIVSSLGLLVLGSLLTVAVFLNIPTSAPTVVPQVIPPTLAAQAIATRTPTPLDIGSVTIAPASRRVNLVPSFLDNSTRAVQSPLALVAVVVILGAFALGVGIWFAVARGRRSPSPGALALVGPGSYAAGVTRKVLSVARTTGAVQEIGSVAVHEPSVPHLQALSGSVKTNAPRIVYAHNKLDANQPRGGLHTLVDQYLSEKGSSHIMPSMFDELERELRRKGVNLAGIQLLVGFGGTQGPRYWRDFAHHLTRKHPRAPLDAWVQIPSEYPGRSNFLADSAELLRDVRFRSVTIVDDQRGRDIDGGRLHDQGLATLCGVLYAPTARSLPNFRTPPRDSYNLLADITKNGEAVGSTILTIATAISKVAVRRGTVQDDAVARAIFEAVDSVLDDPTAAALAVDGRAMDRRHCVAVIVPSSKRQFERVLIILDREYRNHRLAPEGPNFYERNPYLAMRVTRRTVQRGEEADIIAVHLYQLPNGIRDIESALATTLHPSDPRGERPLKGISHAA